MVTIVVTGTGNDELQRRMEIIKENGETKTCPQSSDYPIEQDKSAGSYLSDDTIVICGGYYQR